MSTCPYSLEILGWNDFFAQEFNKIDKTCYFPARVCVEHRGAYELLCEKGRYTGEVTGRFIFTSNTRAKLPKTGDWVIAEDCGNSMAVIHGILPRKTCFSRRSAGKSAIEQVIAANIDYIFIVQSLDRNFNIKRIERSLVMVHEGGATPVVILNKTDLCEDVEDKIQQVQAIAPGLTVLAVSALNKTGMESLENILCPGKTFALIGSSGVGKSTLINTLAGDEIQDTSQVRESDSKGRHTTIRRELLVLHHGLIIDTPGIREIQLWKADDGIQDTFTKIQEIAQDCKFSDCRHDRESGCAIKQALEDGLISQENFDSYQKLQAELASLELRKEKSGAKKRTKEQKWISREIKRLKKNSGIRQ